MSRKTFQETQTKQIMNRVTAPSMPFEWSINPYRGCTHGCSFCYARKTHAFLGMEADDTFQNHILLKMNAAESLEAQLQRTSKRFKGDWLETVRHIGLVAIGTATDPYQPVEAKVGLTRECLKLLAQYRIPTTITTRSPLILRDMDILKEMFITSINISVNTLDREIWRNLEPATPFPMKRLETVQQLVENGIHTGIFVAPILPFLTDRAPDLEALFQAAQEHRVQFATPSVLRLGPEVKMWYFQTIEQHYPKLLPRYAQMYRTGYPTKIYMEALMNRVRPLMTRYGLNNNDSDMKDWRQKWLSQQKLDMPAPGRSDTGVDDTGPVQLSFSL